ncbi:hypothetical protein KKA17_07005 [bacterium]|nr:hypothetical protein [bacterium]MBU1883475.1 hypothetical protein [bacterium]
MEEKIVITNRRSAQGKKKPILFFSLQVILLELLSYLFLVLFNAENLVGISFIAIVQIVPFMLMVKSYKRVIRRQTQRDLAQSQESVADISQE